MTASSVTVSATIAPPRSEPRRIAPLPRAFADLQHFVPEYALESEEQRFAKLHAIDYETLARFYAEMLPRLDAILEHLSHCRLSAMSPSDKTLFDLTMTMVETSHPMDLGWGATDFPGAYRWDAFEFATISTVSKAKVVA